MFAVDQTIETSLPAARPLPSSANFVPPGAVSGVALRTPMVAAGTDAGATGPARAGTPGITGGGIGFGSATATAGRRSSAPASVAPAIASFRLQEAVSEWGAAHDRFLSGCYGVMVRREVPASPSCENDVLPPSFVWTSTLNDTMPSG